MSCNVTLQSDSQKVSTSHIKNNRAETNIRFLAELRLLLNFTTVSVTTLSFFLLFFYSVSPYPYCSVTAAWTPAWQTPPVRACSVVLQTAVGVVVL